MLIWIVFRITVSAKIMKNHHFLYTIGLCLLSQIIQFSCSAQLGGSTTFEYLNLPNNARSIALGGQNITSSGQDVNMFTANPALLVDSVADKVSFSYIMQMLTALQPLTRKS